MFYARLKNTGTRQILGMKYLKEEHLRRRVTTAGRPSPAPAVAHKVKEKQVCRKSTKARMRHAVKSNPVLCNKLFHE